MRVLHICESVTGGIATYLNELIPHQISIYGIENVKLIVASEQLEELTVPLSIIDTFEQLNRRSVPAQWKMARTYLKGVNEFQPIGNIRIGCRPAGGQLDSATYLFRSFLRIPL